MIKSNHFLIEKEVPWEVAAEGITRQIMGFDATMMMVKVKFEKGAIGYEHQHFHTQSSYVVSGKFEVILNGEKRILEAGDGFYAEPNTLHGAFCIEEGVLIDVFSPMREDFIAP